MTSALSFPLGQMIDFHSLSVFCSKIPPPLKRLFALQVPRLAKAG
jgi:hypothetical protein